MTAPVCLQAMEALNFLFSARIIINDGHDILTRLTAGEGLADAVEELAPKFGRAKQGTAVRKVAAAWPSAHIEAVEQIVQWALGKLDTPERININWVGNADHPRTVTRFELDGPNLTIEFAHPPGSLAGAASD